MTATQEQIELVEKMADDYEYRVYMTPPGNSPDKWEPLEARANALRALLREREELKRMWEEETSLETRNAQNRAEALEVKLAEAQREIERERAAHEETRRRYELVAAGLQHMIKARNEVEAAPTPARLREAVGDGVLQSIHGYAMLIRDQGCRPERIDAIIQAAESGRALLAEPADKKGESDAASK